MTVSLRGVVRWHRPLMWATVALLVIGAVSTAGYFLDGRVLVGAPIWAKPLKFSVSFAVYAVTLAWLTSRLQRPRVRRLAHRTGTAIAVAIGLEMAGIVLQVVRGTQSHFNFSTPFDRLVFAAMGVSVVVIFLATVAVGIAFLIESPVADRATTWAVRLGIAISLAGMSVGFLMVVPRPGQTSIRGAHSIGVADGGPSLPLLGWDTTGGDLRIPHFIGLHALQAIPLLALALSLLPATARLTDDARVRLVALGAAGWTGLFALTLWQAYRGQPITAPDHWTVITAVVLLLVVAAIACAVLRSARPDAADDEPAIGVPARGRDVSSAPVT